jgi:hypothetical protein
MRDDRRTNLIQEIEAIRGSKVIAFLTGDRMKMQTQIAFDQLSPLYDHLTAVGPQKKIDLFIYSPGGMTLAGFALVNLVREFCDQMSVLVPFKAHSCATLISLGADEIVMGRLGQLSPVDPTITSPYNPSLPNPAMGAQPQFLPLSVEDVSGYIDLAKKELGLEEESSMVQILQMLATSVSPIALGNVHRSRQQIGMLAKKLLLMHWPATKSKTIEQIVKTLTRELGSHDYIISRKEARDQLRLPVVFPSAELESKMWALFKCYEQAMELTTPYNEMAVLGTQPDVTATFRRGFIESTALTHVYESHRRLRRIQALQGGVPVQGIEQVVLREAWVEYRPDATAPTAQ